MPYPATPRTWVAGDVLTAAQMNAELRDALLGAFPLGPPDGAWTAFTPTLTQGVTVTKTVTYAKYTRIGRTITAHYNLSVTGAGTAGTGIILGLPVAQAANLASIGVGLLYDVSADAAYKILIENGGASTCLMRGMSVTTNTFMGSGSPFALALAAGDLITGSITYESAT